MAVVLPTSQMPRLCRMSGETVTSTPTALPVTPTSTNGVSLSVKSIGTSPILGFESRSKYEA